jgi:hypothetical protein
MAMVDSLTRTLWTSFSQVHLIRFGTEIMRYRVLTLLMSIEIGLLSLFISQDIYFRTLHK